MPNRKFEEVSDGYAVIQELAASRWHHFDGMPFWQRISRISVILGHMAETVEFRSNGQVASGYFVTPAVGSGPGVLVIQEWWGLDSGIKEMADRLGSAGFVALAPDLYHGELVSCPSGSCDKSW
jgi:hypothetical protein